MSELYIGLMSGTSVDGIDAGLLEFTNNTFKLLEFEYTPFQESTKQAIHTLSSADRAIFLKDYGLLDAQLGHLFAEASNNLLVKSGIKSSEVTAIGSHGQTMHHAPDLSPAFSLQIGDPNIIAEITGITTISDFRRRDIAAAGQGAPLAPAFHQAIFSQFFNLSKQSVCIINIGGIANITYLSNSNTIGFDTGPGNALMDYWIKKHRGNAYDKNGAWAKSGIINQELLAHLKQDAYFKLDLPKSTGKEYFSPTWLKQIIKQLSSYKQEDIQATLCQLTAETIADAIQQYAPQTSNTLICGGGVHNKHLIESIQKRLKHPVSSTAKFNINPDHVEAMAFAWLAKQTINNLSGNLPEVTGAKNAVILGGIYPGKKGLSRK